MSKTRSVIFSLFFFAALLMGVCSTVFAATNVSVKLSKTYKTILLVDYMGEAETVLIDGRKTQLDGSLVKVVRVKAGDSVPSLPTPPYHSGYVFKEWHGIKAGDRIGNGGIKISYSRYTANKYRIAYWSGDAAATGKVSYESAGHRRTISLKNCTYAVKGKKFIGWRSKTDGKIYKAGQNVEVRWFDAGLKSGDDIVFIAQWKEDNTRYSVSYELNGGVLPSSAKTSYYFSDPSFQLPIPERKGYVFDGWSGTGLGNARKETVIVPSGSQGDRRYTAHWKKQKWVFFGDSYGMVGGTSEKQISEFFTQGIGLKKYGGTYKDLSKSGYGMARKKSAKYGSFLEVISAQTKDSAVTHIMIIGGIQNDFRCTREEIINATIQFKKLCGVKYPNAKVYYIIPNWHANWQGNEEGQAQVRRFQDRAIERMPWYQEACRQAGITFLSGPEYALRKANNDHYFIEDGHHPNVEGKKVIAAAAVKAYLKAS